MIVRFQNSFHVPGFGRRRFQKGVVMDVPGSLRDVLPKTAEILPDDFREDGAPMTPEEELRVADSYRAQAEAMPLQQSGHAGLAEEDVYEDVEEQAPFSKKKGKRS